MIINIKEVIPAPKFLEQFGMFLTSGVNKIVREGRIQLVLQVQEFSNNAAVRTSQVFCAEISEYFDGVTIVLQIVNI